MDTSSSQTRIKLAQDNSGYNYGIVVLLCLFQKGMQWYKAATQTVAHSMALQQQARRKPTSINNGHDHRHPVYTKETMATAMSLLTRSWMWTVMQDNAPPKRTRDKISRMPLSSIHFRSEPNLHLAIPKGLGSHDNSPNRVSYACRCSRWTQIVLTLLQA